MQDSQQPQTTRSGRGVDGCGLANARRMEPTSLSRAAVGKLFGNLMVISEERLRVGRHTYLLTKCTLCGMERWQAQNNLRRGLAGCRKCGRAKAKGREALRVPKWLYQRAQAAQQRCVNPTEGSYPRYGGRGIEFHFESPRAMALWVQENLGLRPDMEIDRINNNGHYEAGNLRWATGAQNLANSRKSKVSAEFHAFKMAHPEIRYADSTLRHLLLEGMTPEQIIERYHRPSCKPKGVYGTFSTPDPVIASRLKGCSSQTV